MSLTGRDKTREKLIAAFAARKIVCADIAGLDESGTRNGLPVKHAYSVIGYDAHSDVVTLRNPWGVATGGPTGGDVMSGVFRFCLEEADDNFLDIYYEE